MLNAILGTKEKMAATYVEDTRVPVTWVKAGPCIVTQIKRMDSDGYWAVQLGFGSKKIKNITKPLRGHLEKAIQNSALKDQTKLPRFLREIRLEQEPEVKVGDQILASDLFKKGDVVAVTGISKGKGFAGVVKRWHFAGGPKTHGQSDRERAPGAIGQGTSPGRVYKGKHMAGRMGGDTVTVKNLIITDIDSEGKRVAISGALPGSYESLLIIKKIGSGKLSELVEETPEVIEQEEVAESPAKETAEDRKKEEKEDEEKSRKGGDSIKLPKEAEKDK
jgi:large subunit ribosomal protein L3